MLLCAQHNPRRGERKKEERRTKIVCGRGGWASCCIRGKYGLTPTCNNERSKLLPQKRKKSCCFVAVASSGAMNFPSPRCCSKQKMDRLLLFFGSPPQNERPRKAKATPTDSARVRWREKKEAKCKIARISFILSIHR